MNTTDMWWEKKGHLEVRDDGLFIGGISAQALAETYGTPVYVYDLERVRHNYQVLHSALESRLGQFHPRIYYAAKANLNPAILRTLREMGAGVDASSPGELRAALQAGFDPKQMLFTGTSVSQEDLHQALVHDVLVNVDSASALRQISNLSPGVNIMLRHNPGIGAGRSGALVTATLGPGKVSKFGLPRKDLLQAARLAGDLGLNVIGIHQHIGSGWLRKAQIKRSLEAVSATISVMEWLRNQCGTPVRILDVGGGLGVRRRGNEPSFSAQDYASGILNRLERADLVPETLIVEPGAFLVEDAGILLARVTLVDRKAGHWFVGLDAGLNVLNGPAFYGDCYEIVPVQKPGNRRAKPYTVVGNICEPRDVFAERRWLPLVEEGDIIAVLNCGAYASVFACFYNGRPIPGEVCLMNGRVVLTSKQREVYSIVAESAMMEVTG